MMTTERMTTCPLCQSLDADVIRVGIRENPNAEVYGCSCGLQYIAPPFDDPQAYYDLEYRKEHNPVPWSEMTAQQRYDYYRPLMDLRLPHFREHVPTGRTVLEVGCSAGHYLDVLSRNGYEARGCDYNEDDVHHVNRVLGIPCDWGDIETAFQGKEFGAICAYHVFEHVMDPREWIAKAYERLRPGGILYIQVPNLDDALVSIYDIPEFRQRWYREPHLTYWNGDTLRTVMEQVGFNVTISYDQLYSLGNHFWWNFMKKPMPDPATAQTPMSLSEELNHTFETMDYLYRQELIRRGKSDLLIGVGVKPS